MGCTYDSKLVPREMHHFGNFAHLNPAPFTHPASSSTSLPQSVSSMDPTPSDNPGVRSAYTSYRCSTVKLRDFQCKCLRNFGSVISGTSSPSSFREDLNTLAKRQIQSVVSAAPLKAMATLEFGTSALISSGMVTINAKLTGSTTTS